MRLPCVYGPFFDIILGNGRILTEAKLINQEGYYSIDFKTLESKIDSRTKVILLCNPHNPIGRVWNEDELKKIADLAIKYDLLIISDEIHADFIYSGHKHIPIASLSEEVANRTITCYAPSKTFGLAGLSTSFIVISNSKIRNNFNDILTSLEIDGGNIFGMVGLQAAYSNCDNWLDELIIYLESNRDFVVDYINENIPKLKVYPPEGTYLLWINCENLGFNNPDDLIDFFVKKAKLGLNRGIRFESQSNQFMRLNFACPRHILKKGLQQLNLAIKNLD